MLRIVHEKHERHEKNIRCRFLADGGIPGMHSQTPKTSSLRHTPRSVGKKPVYLAAGASVETRPWRKVRTAKSGVAANGCPAKAEDQSNRDESDRVRFGWSV